MIEILGIPLGPMDKAFKKKNEARGIPRPSGNCTIINHLSCSSFEYVYPNMMVRISIDSRVALKC